MYTYRHIYIYIITTGYCFYVSLYLSYALLHVALSKHCIPDYLPVSVGFGSEVMVFVGSTGTVQAAISAAIIIIARLTKTSQARAMTIRNEQSYKATTGIKP